MISLDHSPVFNLPNWMGDWMTPARYKIAYGGRGSGKSWGIATLLLVSAYQKSKRILCAREYQASIADSVHKLLADLIVKSGLRGFSIGKTEITHRNGSRFIFRGLARNPHSIRSMEGIDAVWIEEAQSVSEESWRQLIPTIRAENSEIWISYNPRYLNDPTSLRFYGDKCPKRAIVSEVNYDRNPWFPEVLRAEMQADFETDPDRARHVWLGKPLTNSHAQVLFGKWIVQDFTPGAGWDGPYFGIDWGISEPTAAVKCWLFNDILFIEKELYVRGVDDMPAFLKRMPELQTHTARADNSWPETIRSVQRAGFGRLAACEKWPGSVDDGIVWLRGRQKIIIHPRCVSTAREASLWRYKTDAGENILPALQPGDDHTWDAVRYALEQHIRKRQKAAAYNG